MIERRNWKTRLWANRDQSAVTGDAETAPVATPVRRLPHLWFVADRAPGALLQVWAIDATTAYVPCFRSAEDAVAMAARAGAGTVRPIGFPLLDIPDLMADLSHRVFLVTAVGESGHIDGQYLPEIPKTTARGAVQAA